MRCRLTALCVLFLLVSFFPLNLRALTREDALRTLQTLQSLCESGLNIESYSTALDEAQNELDQFLNSREGQKSPQFSEAVARALVAYQSAFLIWQAKVTWRQDYVRSDHPTSRLMLHVYPEAASLFRQEGQAHVPSLVTFFWDQADKRISEAKKLLRGKGKR